MQCSKCGSFIQAGAAFCSECGTLVSPNQVEPTVAAPPPYAGQAYPPPANPTPAPPAYTGYGAPPPDNPYPYAPPPNAYSTPYAPPPANAYSTPYAPPPGTYAPPSQPQPPRRKGPNLWLIAGIVVLLLVVVGGGVLAFRAFNNSTGTTPSATATSSTNNSTPAASSPTVAVTPTTNQGPSPSGSPIDPTSAGIITNVQTASGIDSNDLPTTLTSQFSVGQTAYVTFNLNLPSSGYVQAKVYSDSTFVGKATLTANMGQVDHGYFNVTINRASTGYVEIYWCTMSDCSDASLGALATFTVS
jgi:hypothetical protein